MTEFGTIKYAGRWLIETEPHVRARLKRVFPRAPQSTGAVLVLSDTPEHARELDWFLRRYPMVLDAASRARLEAQAQAHVDMETRLADLQSGRLPPREVHLAIPPRAY